MNFPSCHSQSGSQSEQSDYRTVYPRNYRDLGTRWKKSGWFEAHICVTRRVKPECGSGVVGIHAGLRSRRSAWHPNHDINEDAPTAMGTPSTQAARPHNHGGDGNATERRRWDVSTGDSEATRGR
ncbi:hypothetical protein EDB83DRAFT_2323091 [Lactarius deliciosus]|nr:hypothetical protein EDB83DRAFT_2323091 [Lactarius deliciosus]